MPYKTGRVSRRTNTGLDSSVPEQPTVLFPRKYHQHVAMSLRLAANPARALISSPVCFCAIRPSPSVGLVRLYSQRILSNGLVSDRPLRTRQKTGDGLASFLQDPADPEDLLDHEGPWSKISETVKSDHRQLEVYYKKIVNSTDAEEQERYQNAFVWKLSRHSIAEELVLYPSLEKYIPGGYLLAKKGRSHHLDVGAGPLLSFWATN